MTKRELTQLDVRYQEALQHITGTVPPADFYFNPTTEERDTQNTRQQSWAVDHVKPTWACGLSVLDAARAYVTEAIGNSNIGSDGSLKEDCVDNDESSLRATGRTTRMCLEIVHVASKLAAAAGVDAYPKGFTGYRYNIILVVTKNRTLGDTLSSIVGAAKGFCVNTSYGYSLCWTVKGYGREEILTRSEVHLLNNHASLRGRHPGQVFVSHEYLEELRSKDVREYQLLEELIRKMRDE